MPNSQFITLVEHDFDDHDDDTEFLVARSNVVSVYDSSFEHRMSGKWTIRTTVSFKNGIAVRSGQPLRSIEVNQPYKTVAAQVRGESE